MFGKIQKTRSGAVLSPVRGLSGEDGGDQRAGSAPEDRCDRRIAESERSAQTRGQGVFGRQGSGKEVKIALHKNDRFKNRASRGGKALRTMLENGRPTGARCGA